MSDKLREPDESAQDPLPLALIACDSVYRDSLSQRCTLLGLFVELSATTLPWQTSFFVYFAFTDALPGETTLTLRVIDSEEDREPVFELDETVEVVPIEVEFLEAGEYRIQVLVGRNYLLERRIAVLGLSEEGDENE